MSETAPFFIVGANRSGTTLLRLMLGAHPRLAVPDELIYFHHRVAGASPRDWRAPGLSSSAYHEFVHQWLMRRADALPGLTESDLAALVDTIAQHPSRDLREPYRATAEAWTERQGKVRWGEKTPGNLFYVDVLFDMFPEARFIHLVRDPRACVLSMIQAKRFGSDPVLCALNRRRFVQEGGAFLERTVPPTQRTTLRYEDLVCDPEGVARRLCSFLREDFDSAMLGFHRHAAAVMKKEAAEGYNSLATRPVTDTRSEAWREEMPPNVQAKIDVVSRSDFTRYGYEPSGETPKARDWADVLIKWAYWKSKVIKHKGQPGYTVKYRAFEGVHKRLQKAIAD